MSVHKQPRTAIVHYWLVGMRGGERVLERLIHLFPDADIFTHVVVPEALSATIRSRPIKTSFIQKLPGAKRHYQRYLPLMPLALEQLDLRGYDLVISSESGPAKGVLPAPDTLHISYVHSPMRYLWDHYHDYRDSAGILSRLVMPPLFHYLRNWDTVSAGRVDRIVANSNFVRKRISKVWRRDSAVVHPPVAVSEFRSSNAVNDRYLWVGQMIAYKRPDVVVEAFNRLGLPLLMVGDGALHERIRKMAKPNVTVLKRLDFNGLKQAYSTCRALVFSAEEDFGIVPVEANASGRPVLAFGRGGVLDSIIPGQTGLFYHEQSVEGLIDGIEELEKWIGNFDSDMAMANARRFSPERFDEGFMAQVREGGL